MLQAIVILAIAMVFVTPAVSAQQEMEPTMDLKHHKSLSRESLQMWAGDSSGDPSDIFAETYRNHQEPAAGGGVTAIGLEQWIDLVKANHQAFPDLEVKFLQQVAEDDLVATHWQFSATQRGTYEGLAPTDKRVTWTGMSIDRFEDGKIVESWVSWDKYTQFEALGLISR